MKVLITGACGGIGREITNFLSKKNVDIVACDLLEKTEAEKIFLEPGKIKYFKLDISKINQIEEVFERLKDAEKFDAIMHIAGIFEIDSFIEINAALLQKMFETNLLGVIHFNRIFHSILQEKGRIIITTSEVAPLAPMPFNGVYNVTKTALDAYCQALRQELNLLGQKVITIRPGAFNTKLSQGALTKTKELTEKTILYKSQAQNFYNLVKMFMGKPQPPEKLCKTYYKALTKRRPKLIYKKHTNPLLKLTNLLPLRLQCLAVKSLIKNKNKNYKKKTNK